MTNDRTDSFTDVVNLLATPLASGIRTVDQVRRGVDELLRAIENFNRTLENWNEVAERANRLLGEIEEPIHAWIPQVTRTVRAADEITRRLEGPVAAAAPNIERAVGALASPAFAQLPQQMGEFVGLVGEMSKRLGPLTQLAESAGGIFGGFKIPGMSGSATARPSAEPAADPAPAAKVTAKKASPRATTARKAPAKKAAAKKVSPARKATAKKVAK